MQELKEILIDLTKKEVVEDKEVTKDDLDYLEDYLKELAEE